MESPQVAVSALFFTTLPSFMGVPKSEGVLFLNPRGLEPPEVLEDRETGQNHPKHVEKDDCWKGLCRR